MSNTIDIKVPDIGDFSEVEVIEVLVAEGDAIQAEQSLITVESDKASMEIPAPQGGRIASLKVKVGDKIKEGSVILTVEPEQAAVAEKAPDSQGDKSQAPAKEAPTQDQAPAPAAPQPAAAAETEPASSGGTVTVSVPDIGDATDVEVIEVLVAVGDTVAAEQSLITVESDKASMEVPSSQAGVVTAINVKVGDKVNQGSNILELKTAAAAAPAKAAAPAPAAAAGDKGNGKEKQAEQPVEQPSTDAQLASVPPERHSPTESFSEADVPARNLPHASPSVRKFARELGVNLTSVQGSGRKNRIT